MAPVRVGRLVEDYLAGRTPAADFYAGHPLRVATYARKLDEVRARFPREARETAARALRPTSTAAAERLRRFVDEGGAMVTTGQQAGLFTGPLYTIHKILTAIRLAESLEDALGIAVLPVFWVASEDHDFAEAAQTYAVAGDGDLRRFAAERTDPRPLPMADMRLGRDVDVLSGELRELIGGTGDTHSCVTRVLGAYRAGTTVAGAFGDAIATLFAGFDLLVTDAGDPVLKAASAGVMADEARHAGPRARALAERGAAIEAAGYAAQVALVPDSPNLFFHGPQGRERIVRGRAGDWRAPENRLRFGAEELVEAIVAEPARFSPNVLLRPVVESAVFPTLAYVAGPAEAAYFAQAGPLFEASGIRPPAVFPRYGATIVPTHAAEALARLPLDEGELALPAHEAWNLAARRSLPGDVRDGITRMRASLVEAFGPLMESAARIDPNLEPAVGARRDRALLEAAEAERKVLSHFKRRHPEIHERLRTARNHLFPLGAPQERVLNVLPFLARDPRLLHRLAAAMEVRLEPAPASPPRPA